MAETHDRTPVKGHRILPTPDPITDWKIRRFTDPKYMKCPSCNGLPRGCPHCNFWGTVLLDGPDAKCIHVWKHVERIAECLNRYACTHCGATKEVDSSD